LGTALTTLFLAAALATLAALTLTCSLAASRLLATAATTLSLIWHLQSS
jgi:hypothetical protein